MSGVSKNTLQRRGTSRSRWFDNYVRLVIERDVLELSRVRQRELLPRMLVKLAAQTGQLLNIAKVARAVGLEPSTAGAARPARERRLPSQLRGGPVSGGRHQLGTVV